MDRTLFKYYIDKIALRIRPGSINSSSISLLKQNKHLVKNNNIYNNILYIRNICLIKSIKPE